MNNTQQITLDLSAEPPFQRITAKQGDKQTRFIGCILTNNSVAATLESGLTVYYACRKPDKTQVVNTATYTDNIVTVELSEQCLTVAGTCEVEVFLQKGEAVLTSATFQLVVEPNVYDENAVESSDEYGILGGLVESASTAIDKANTAANDANTATANANQATEAAKTATTNAESATEAANTATSNANSAATAANTAADSANSAATAANTAATNANAEYERLKDVDVATLQSSIDTVKLSTTVFAEASTSTTARTTTIDGVTSWDDVLNIPINIKASTYGISTASTLNINGLGTKSLYFPSPSGTGVTTTPPYYWIRTGQVYTVVWTGTYLVVTNTQVRQATTSYAGIVQLTNSTSSTSTTTAATPSSVKAVQDNVDTINSTLSTEEYEDPNLSSTGQGIYKSPSGLMMQWSAIRCQGLSSHSGSGNYRTYITFREAFTQQPIINTTFRYGQGYAGTNVSDMTTAGFYIYSQTNLANAYVHWWAIGTWK